MQPHFKIVAFTALHYGLEYLQWAARSVIDDVDEWHIAYARVGSHGHRTEIPCPETEQQLRIAATQIAGHKLRWHPGEWNVEGHQREMIYEYAPDADVIIILDADEIWHDGLVQHAIAYSAQRNDREWRLPMIHFWRSFRRAVLHDPAYPVRLVWPKRARQEASAYIAPRAREDMICHFGYAQKLETVKYKLQVHGHRNELRETWYNEVYVTNRQTDCHPVGSVFWNPEDVNPLDWMPAWMESHPNFGKDMIE